MAMDVGAIQDYLREYDLDGWLLADFHGRNSIAVEMLNLQGMLTRRSFYYIPAIGDPVGIVHAIERERFEHLPGKIVTYSDYRLMERELERALGGAGKVAMEYSPMGRLPYIGLVDGGTIELVRHFGIEVASSANLVAYFQARLSVEQIATHRMAARNLIEIKDRAFDHIRKGLTEGTPVTEYDVVQFILQEFANYDMVTGSAPICAIGANAGNPHYEPTAKSCDEIKRGQLVLIDLWAKLDRPEGIFGDITWMGFTGTAEEIPQRYRDIFAVVAKARDAAIEYLRANAGTKPIKGAQVDDVCRGVIEDAGYGKAFTHRTGHSITTSEHGTGPNIDNLETEDNRKLRKGHLFSIEPGIYLEDCGFRTEIDMLISYDGAEVTTLPLQTEIKALF